jgi:hypothetical protein
MRAALGAWSGLIVGILSFGIALQVNYAVVAWSCVHNIQLIPWVSAGMAAVALVAGVISLRTPRRTLSTALQFTGQVSFISAVLSAIAILLQGAAVAIISPCM